MSQMARESSEFATLHIVLRRSIIIGLLLWGTVGYQAGGYTDPLWYCADKHDLLRNSWGTWEWSKFILQLIYATLQTCYADHMV